MSQLAPSLEGTILDVGCGEKPYRELFTSPLYVGIDLRRQRTGSPHHADIYYDGFRLPFADLTFDNVVCTEVIEHVPNPYRFIGELNRVLKDGGKIVLTTPFVWEEHEQPHDYNRFSSYGLIHLAQTAGFETVTLVKTLPGLAAILQLLCAHLFSISRGRNKFLKAFTTPLFIAPLSVLGALIEPTSSQKCSFYMGNVALLRKRRTPDTAASYP